MSSYRVVADENIPYVREAFAAFGAVDLFAAKAITAAVVKDADLLLVRSVTKVDEALLKDSRVRYVATATIGFDHIDRDYLDRRGLVFASAPGSNANSVSEWVTAALLRLSRERGFSLGGKTLGVIGVGNVGVRVAAKARALGMNVLLRDPPRARAEGDVAFTPLPRLLAESDVITTHVPLNRDGEDKTLGLANAAFFDAMKPGAIYFNSSRGDVVDEPALLAALAKEKPVCAVLDVWENEPDIAAETLRAAAIATPHIAGYSFDGKVAGTVMIYEAACKTFGLPATWTPDALLPAPEVPRVALDAKGRTDEDVLDELVRAVYPIRDDDARLREAFIRPDGIGKHFTRLRKEYPRRREFQHTRVELRNASAGLAAKIAGLGFSGQTPGKD